MKIVSKIRVELKTNGKIEIISDDLKSVMIAKDAIVMPIANDPVFPTNIFP
jgi:hypothetical protein